MFILKMFHFRLGAFSNYSQLLLSKLSIKTWWNWQDNYFTNLKNNVTVNNIIKEKALIDGHECFYWVQVCLF